MLQIFHITQDYFDVRSGRLENHLAPWLLGNLSLKLYEIIRKVVGLWPEVVVLHEKKLHSRQRSCKVGTLKMIGHAREVIKLLSWLDLTDKAME